MLDDGKNFLSGLAGVTPLPEPAVVPTHDTFIDGDDELDTFEELKRRDAFGRRDARIPPIAWTADDQHPEYNHLLVAERKGVAASKTFTLTPAVLDLIIAMNGYKPQGPGDTFVVVIRGGALSTGTIFEQVASAAMEETRPDHKEFRCTVGYYHRKEGRLSLFRGSSVPNVHYMSNYFKLKNNIPTRSSFFSNLLPSGCYRYIVGPHNKVIPALRLADHDNPNNSGEVTTMRTNADPAAKALTYDFNCLWDKCFPGDNVHCARTMTEFSSAGCQTIQGPDGGGPWGKFQNVLQNHKAGTPFDLVLVTGKECAIAAHLIAQGQAAQKTLTEPLLMRLRHGSEGNAVKALQLALGIKPTGFLGAATKKALVEREKSFGSADVRPDAIFSPADEAAFGWTIFNAPPVPANAAPAEAAAAPAPTPALGMPVAAPAQTPAPPPPPAIEPPMGQAAFQPETLVLIEGPQGARVTPDHKTMIVPGEGTWTVGPKLGVLNFTPEPGFSGRTQPVRYEILDIYSRAATALATVTVAPNAKPPVLSPDAARTMSGRPVKVAVLMNDVAPEGVIDPNTLQFAAGQQGTLTADGRSLTVPGQGVWTVGTGGLIDFSPFLGFLGVARATYRVSTDKGATEKSTVTVTVDREVGPAVMQDDTGETKQGQAVGIDVLKNDMLGAPAVAPTPIPAPTPAADPQAASPVPQTAPPQAPGSPAAAVPASPPPAAPAAPVIPAAPAVPVPAAPPAGAIRLTAETLARFAPRAQEKYVRAFSTKGDETLGRYGINANATRVAHFLAQISHESNGFAVDVENLNYSASRLLQVFPKYYSSSGAAEADARKPELIANRVYGNRLGNASPGDGYRYRGRGIIQLTGRDNYRTYGRKLGIDLEGNPDLATDGETAIAVAACFWDSCAKVNGLSMNQLADGGRIEDITKRINGGFNGIADRKTRFENAWGIWGSGRAPRSAGDSGLLQRGLDGPRVRALETNLTRAGYDPGPVDGIFDGRTERAVMLYQMDRGLNVDGRADAALQKRLEAEPAVQAPPAPVPAESEGRRGVNNRDPRTLEPPSGGIHKNGHIFELLSVLMAIAAIASLVLMSVARGGPGATVIWLPVALAAVAAILWVLSVPDHKTASRPAPAPSPQPSPQAQPAVPAPPSPVPAGSRDPKADDDALRKLGINPNDFEETEPVRIFPPDPEGDGDNPAQSLAASPAPIAFVPHGVAPVRSGTALRPFAVSAPDARFAILAMFGGDNNLSNQVQHNLGQMAKGNGATGVVSVLALIDMLDSPASVVEVTPDGRQRTVEQLEEIDTGDPETLATFLSRALVTFPNARKAIGFWDHGTGVFGEADSKEVLLTRTIRGTRAHRGSARRLFIPAAERASMMARSDKRAMLHDNTGGVLTNLEAGLMLEAAFARAGVTQPVDLIYSDTCLNGMVEVVEELGRFSQTMVGSPETEPNDGWNYTDWLSRLTRQAPAMPEDWCRPAVESFAEGYRNRADQHPCTMGAFRSENQMAETFASLVGVAHQGGIKAWSLMSLARGRAQQYDSRDTYDLISFATELAGISEGEMPELASAALALDRAARESRISYAWLGSNVRASQGLGFWFPASRGSLEADIATYRRLKFSKATGWADYLIAMYGGEA